MSPLRVAMSPFDGDTPSWPIDGYSDETAHESVIVGAIHQIRRQHRATRFTLRWLASCQIDASDARPGLEEVHAINRAPGDQFTLKALHDGARRMEWMLKVSSRSTPRRSPAGMSRSMLK